MPGVRDVRVLAAADSRRGEQVVACLAAEPGQTESVTTVAVRRFCSSRLAPHKIPRTVVVLDAIPMTARGKTDRRALDEAIPLENQRDYLNNCASLQDSVGALRSRVSGRCAH